MLEVSHVKRELNNAAHRLTNKVLSLVDEQVHMEEVLVFNINDIVLARPSV
jgi:hypothetical protein